VLPAKPVIGKLMGAASLGYGNFNAIDGDAMINVPVGDNTAVRLAGKVVDSKGYYSDGTGNTKSQALRAQILTQPSAAVSLRLAADWAHNGGMGVGATYDGLLNFTPGAPASAMRRPITRMFLQIWARGWACCLPRPAFFANTVIGGAFISPAPLDKPFINDTNWGVEGEANLDTSIGKDNTAGLSQIDPGRPVQRGAQFPRGTNQGKQPSVQCRSAACG
jgi:iron complex outermembrane receptor protein